MKEERIRTQEAAEQMKINIAALERLLQEKDLQNRTPDVLVSEINERQGSNSIFIERNCDIGKCDLLRKVQQMGEELRRLKEGRTLPTGCDSENDEEDNIRLHAVNSVVRLETIYEEDEPPECDSENDESNESKEHTVSVITV